MQNGDTALIIAARKTFFRMGDVDSVKLLVQHGAAVDIRNKVTICTTNIKIRGGRVLSHTYTNSEHHWESNMTSM